MRGDGDGREQDQRLLGELLDDLILQPESSRLLVLRVLYLVQSDILHQ